MNNEKTIIHCDKCDSTNILHGVIRPEPIEVHKKMSEVAHPIGQAHFGIPAVYYYTTYSMTCKDCGHQERYSE